MFTTISNWILARYTTIMTFAGKAFDSADSTVEVRLIGYSLVVFFSILWLSIGLIWAKQITTAWATCFCALCGLVSIASLTINKN